MTQCATHSQEAHKRAGDLTGIAKSMVVLCLDRFTPGFFDDPREGEQGQVAKQQVAKPQPRRDNETHHSGDESINQSKLSGQHHRL